MYCVLGLIMLILPAIEMDDICDSVACITLLVCSGL